MADSSPDLPTALVLLRKAVAKQYGYSLVRAQLFLEGQAEPMCLPVPRCECPAAPAPASPDPGQDLRLSEMERIILEALKDQTLTAQQIAERSGYPYDSHLKTMLAAMRRRGLLSGEPGAPGYRSTLT